MPHYTKRADVDMHIAQDGQGLAVKDGEVVGTDASYWLPEVEIQGRKSQQVESNDATMVANGKEYNQHLKQNALKGAEAHAIFEKQHPSLSKLGYIVGASPFIVMSLPLGLQAAPYLSGSYVAGNAGRVIAGETGAQVGAALGTTADVGLATTGVIHGAKQALNSNNDTFDRVRGFGEGLFSTLPLANTIKILPKVARASIADNVVPMGYKFQPTVNYSRAKQGIETTKGMLERMSHPNDFVDSTPNWMFKVDYKVSPGGVKMNKAINYRQDAINLAMKQPQYHNTYVKSGDTYDYNLDITRPDYSLVVSGRKVDPVSNKELAAKMHEGESKLIGDNITSNAGFANLKKENGKLVMTDVWDVQPFKDADRLPFGWFGKFMHKTYPNFELVKFVRGNPFTLKTQLVE